MSQEQSLPAYLPISIFVFVLLSLISGIKMLCIKRNIMTNKPIFLIIRIIELLALVFISKISFLFVWAYVGIIFIFIITSLAIGHRRSLILALGTFVFNILLSFLFYYTKGTTTFSSFGIVNTIYFDILFGISIVSISVLSGMIQKDNTDTENQNKMLVGEIEEKYDLLALAQQEIKSHYNKLKYSNKKLEETNLKLSNSIGEFYTLHQISNAISSILNIKELLRYVNDVIIGVMGVQYSTIAIFDEKKERLKVHTTNISDSDNLFDLSSNINSPLILETLESGKPIVNNFANSTSYSFTSGREINSLICMPLISKTRKLGIVLIEHKLNNAFGDDKKRLLDIICQQVSIAMENAGLYQKMHVIAITDWLTGVYNRVHFQQILPIELSKAKENKYQLCVGIFDIDWFKKFNDTYGHLFGDKVIKAVAEAVSESLKSTELIARYGGEEFIILMPMTTLDEAYERLEFLRSKIENTVVTDEQTTVSVTASFGVAGYPSTADTDNDLLKNADTALYEAKNAGRNCVRVFC